MGCDIHLIVQTRDGARGAWKTTTAPRTCKNCKDGKCERSGDKCYWCDGTKLVGGFDSRSYDTFAILANVRNGHGFAGCDTGDGFVPIALPRGLPPGVTDDGGDLGDHSFSHLTLAELLTYPHWEKLTTKRGSLSLREFEAWDAKGGGWPESWSGGTMGARVFYVSNETARGLLKDGYLRAVADRAERAKQFKWQGMSGTDWDYSAFYTNVSWQAPYKDCAREFHDEFIPALVKLGKPDNVRIVFGFDS